MVNTLPPEDPRSPASPHAPYQPSAGVTNADANPRGQNVADAPTPEEFLSDNEDWEVAAQMTQGKDAFVRKTVAVEVDEKDLDSDKVYLSNADTKPVSADDLENTFHPAQLATDTSDGSMEPDGKGGFKAVSRKQSDNKPAGPSTTNSQPKPANK